MNWYIFGNTWLRCDILSNIMGRATVRIWTTGETMTGKARKGLYGLLVDGSLPSQN